MSGLVGLIYNNGTDASGQPIHTAVDATHGLPVQTVGGGPGGSSMNLVGFNGLTGVDTGSGSTTTNTIRTAIATDTVLTGTFTAINTAAYAAVPSAISVTTSSGSIVAAGVYTKTLVLTSVSGAGTVFLNPAGGTAALNTGHVIWPGGSFSYGGNIPVPTGSITAISSSGTVTLAAAGA